MNNLTRQQEKFFELISKHPDIAKLWSIESRTVDIKAYRRAIKKMNYSDAVIAKFFFSVWNNASYFVDIADLALLDAKSRTIITKWLKTPFWP